jgi:hypothetical protein
VSGLDVRTIETSPAPGVERLPAWAYAAALVAFCVLSRLPQLLSPNLLLDGDECVLGLMAKHVAQAKEFPIFFYGQHYGLSSLEAAAGAMGFVLFGTGALTLKCAMLALWTAGIVFLFLALSKYVGTGKAFLITVALVLNPAWAVWSMKARGGYITSFTATAALAYLLAQGRERETILRWLVAGALTSVIYLAQPLWLPGVLPFVVVRLVSRRRLSWAAGYFSVIAAAPLLVRLATTSVARWDGPTLGNGDLLGSLPAVAQQIYTSLTGSYYLWWALEPPGPVTHALAIVWCAMLPAALLVQLYRLFTRRYCSLSHLLFASMCATLVANWVLLSARDARYLLPLSPLLVVFAGVEFVDLLERRVLSQRAAGAVTLAVLLLGGLSLGEFKAFNYLWKNPPSHMAEAKRLQRVIGYLQAKDVRHLYSMNGLLDSQLTFYSDERVVARWIDPVGRYPAYAREVDTPLASGEAVAVVGYTATSGVPGCEMGEACTGGLEHMVANPETIFTVDGKYFVYVGADRDLLQKLGFRFLN